MPFTYSYYSQEYFNVKKNKQPSKSIQNQKSIQIFKIYTDNPNLRFQTRNYRKLKFLPIWYTILNHSAELQEGN